MFNSPHTLHDLINPLAALESSNRPLFPQWSHHVYPQFLPGSHPNHQQAPQVVIQQQHHQHYYQMAAQQQQLHHMSNANNNNYISPNAVANNSPVLHNNHIMNNNHQHLHQSYSLGSGGQMLSNEIQSAAAFYQQQHQFMPHHQRVVGADGNVLINSSAVPVNHSTNGLAQHMKTRNNRLMKNNGLNNNFYRSSGIFLLCSHLCVCVHLIFSAFAFYLINFIVFCHSISLASLSTPHFSPFIPRLLPYIARSSLSTVALTISVKAVLREGRKNKSARLFLLKRTFCWFFRSAFLP